MGKTDIGRLADVLFKRFGAPQRSRDGLVVQTGNFEIIYSTNPSMETLSINRSRSSSIGPVSGDVSAVFYRLGVFDVVGYHGRAPIQPFSPEDIAAAVVNNGNSSAFLGYLAEMVERTRTSGAPEVVLTSKVPAAYLQAFADLFIFRFTQQAAQRQLVA